MHAIAWLIRFGVAPIGFGFALGAIVATRCW